MKRNRHRTHPPAGPARCVNNPGSPDGRPCGANLHKERQKSRADGGAGPASTCRRRAHQRARHLLPKLPVGLTSLTGQAAQLRLDRAVPPGTEHLDGSRPKLSRHGGLTLPGRCGWQRHVSDPIKVGHGAKIIVFLSHSVWRPNSPHSIFFCEDEERNVSSRDQIPHEKRKCCSVAMRSDHL